MNVPTDEAAFRRARRIPWRRFFVLYTVALTAGTHWPSFTLGPAVPATDKTVHLLGFGGLTWLLWRTGWIRSRWIVGLVVLLWSCVDEWSQGWTWVNRHVTRWDVLANALGVVIVITWLWALRPVGRDANRMRLALDQFAFDEILVSRRIQVAVTALFVQFATGFLIARNAISDPAVARAVIVATGAVAVGGCAALFVVQWHWHRAATIAALRCFRCGTPAIDVEFKDGRAVCACGATLRRAQWMIAAPPSRAAFLSATGSPIAWSALVIVGLLAVVAVSNRAYDWLAGTTTAQGATRAAHWLAGLPVELTRTIDLAIALVLAAVFFGTFRRGIARYFDQSVRCRRCRHDLRATPAPDGVGACGECGTSFVRLEDPPVGPVGEDT